MIYRRINNNSSFTLIEPFDKLRASSRQSFTLIELLVVLALVAILSVVVVLTLNPAELLKQARDSNRLSDLATINTALNLFSTDVTSGFMGTSTVVYVSLPSTTSNCSNLGLPTLPSGYTYNCVTSQNLRNTDGTGWIPVNFNRISSNSPISQLPIDPTNTTSSGSYYTYVTGGSWMLSVIPESQKQKLELSNNPHLSKYPGVIGIGNNLDINPLYNSTGLVGYWKFDEGSGNFVGDASGRGHDNGGFWSSGSAAWETSCKVGKCMKFLPASYFVVSNNDGSLDIADALTISLWIKGSIASSTVTSHPINKWSGTTSANYVLYYCGEACSSGDNFNFYANRGGVWGQVGALPPSGVSSGRWNHLVLTYASSTGGISYWNGSSIGSSGSGILNTSGGTVLKIGNNTGLNTFFMDDVRIYNRALSAAEISALYNATK